MKYYKLFCLNLSIILILLSNVSNAQLTVSPNQTAVVLANTLAGSGTAIYSPSLTCLGLANGTFTATGTILAMSNGIVLTNGHASACSGPEGPLESFNDGMPGDPAMAPFLPAGTATVDACILEFDVVANSDTISFNYQFGSEEYRNAVCSIYTDVFAFFISGPGIVGTPNMALVPGTNIPVEINSVNNGGLGTVGGAAHINCTSLGAGSPFTAYYIDNTGGPNMTYRGYTTKFRAFHAVTACDTYHLKLSIVDAGNWQYDSGVFIEGGSLTSDSYAFDHLDSIGATVDGIPHTIVKGCSPATVKINAAHSNTTAQNINLSFGGTAVNGIDVATLPTVIVLPADSTSVSFNVSGIPTPPGGTKTLTIYLNSGCGIADSVILNIMDTPSARILTPDTSVCAGQSFQILVAGTSGLTYTWSPPTGLSSTTVMEPIVTPMVNTTYTMTATLPGSGCPPISRDITITIHNLTVALLTPSDTICLGASVNIHVAGSPSYAYNWTPPTGLNNPNIQDPIATPSVTTTYNVAISDSGCSGMASLTITVLNPSPVILTPDTGICLGTSFVLRVNGDPSLTYFWSPTSSLNNPNIMDPVATPTVTTIYTLTATATTPANVPCSSEFEVSVVIYPPLQLIIGPDQAICLEAPIRLNVLPSGSKYTYLWYGPDSFFSTAENPSIFKSQMDYQGIYSVTVTDTSTGCSGTDTTLVTIYRSSLGLTNVTVSQTISYGSSLQLNADNALYYMWKPDDGSLSNPNINNPVASPLVPTTYTVYGMDIHGCSDSASLTIDLTYGNIFIPDAFTPNGDGLNDYFNIGNLGYYKLDEFSVYNRWGQRIFYTSNSESKGWDGTFNGIQQDMDVYNYLIVVTAPDGTGHTFKGDVTLIR